MTEQSKLFHIGDVLTVLGNDWPLMCLAKRPPLPNGDAAPDRGGEWALGLHEILQFMTKLGDRFEAIDVPRALEATGPFLLEKFPFLADLEPPDFSDVPQHEREEAIYAWVTETAVRLHSEHPDIVRENGWMAIEPLDYFQEQDPEHTFQDEKTRRGGIAVAIGYTANTSGDISRLENVLFDNLTAADVIRITPTEYPEIAQSILAIGNIDVMSLMIRPENIKQDGGNINIETDISDTSDAERVFDKIEQYFREVGLEDYISLQCDTSDGDMRYMVQVDAARLQDDGRTDELVAFVQERTARRGPVR